MHPLLPIETSSSLARSNLSAKQKPSINALQVDVSGFTPLWIINSANLLASSILQFLQSPSISILKHTSGCTPWSIISKNKHLATLGLTILWIFFIFYNIIYHYGAFWMNYFDEKIFTNLGDNHKLSIKNDKSNIISHKNCVSQPYKYSMNLWKNRFSCWCP